MSKDDASVPMPTRVLNAISAMGVECMWEDNKNPNVVGTLNSMLGGRKMPYPIGTIRGICDVVVDGFWIEVKYPWTYKNEKQESSRNPSFHKHLFLQSAAERTAVNDLSVKLPSLIGHPDVTAVGFLLVSFESNSLPFDLRHITRLEQAAGICTPPWSKYQLDSWPNPRNSRCHIRAFYWERSAH